MNSQFEGSSTLIGDGDATPRGKPRRCFPHAPPSFLPLAVMSVRALLVAVAASSFAVAALGPIPFLVVYVAHASLRPLIALNIASLASLVTIVVITVFTTFIVWTMTFMPEATSRVVAALMIFLVHFGMEWTTYDPASKKLGPVVFSLIVLGHIVNPQVPPVSASLALLVSVALAYLAGLVGVFLPVPMTATGLIRKHQARASSAISRALPYLLDQFDRHHGVHEIRAMECLLAHFQAARSSLQSASAVSAYAQYEHPASSLRTISDKLRVLQRMLDCLEGMRESLSQFDPGSGSVPLIRRNTAAAFRAVGAAYQEFLGAVAEGRETTGLIAQLEANMAELRREFTDARAIFLSTYDQDTPMDARSDSQTVDFNATYFFASQFYRIGVLATQQWTDAPFGTRDFAALRATFEKVVSGWSLSALPQETRLRLQSALLLSVGALVGSLFVLVPTLQAAFEWNTGVYITLVFVYTGIGSGSILRSSKDRLTGTFAGLSIGSLIVLIASVTPARAVPFVVVILYSVVVFASMILLTPSVSNSSLLAVTLVAFGGIGAESSQIGPAVYERVLLTFLGVAFLTVLSTPLVFFSTTRSQLRGIAKDSLTLVGKITDTSLNRLVDEIPGDCKKDLETLLVMNRKGELLLGDAMFEPVLWRYPIALTEGKKLFREIRKVQRVLVWLDFYSGLLYDDRDVLKESGMEEAIQSVQAFRGQARICIRDTARLMEYIDGHRDMPFAWDPGALLSIASVLQKQSHKMLLERSRERDILENKHAVNYLGMIFSTKLASRRLVKLFRTTFKLVAAVRPVKFR